MASTFTFPRVVLALGTTVIPATGGASVPDGDNSVTISIDRTVSGGFNSVTSSVQMTVMLSQSDNGGSTWQELAACGPVTGGSVISSKTGLLITVSDLYTQLNPGTSRVVNATVVLTGGRVAVAGTITTA